MRIIFMGTPAFAVPSLEILMKHGYQVVAVVTSRDHFGGRGGKMLLESEVKKCALRYNIPVLQPANLKSPDFLEILGSYRADLQIVVAFRMLPEAVWNMPPMGTYNLHGSLLPRYRGAAPINHAIIQGEKVTGVTAFKLQHTIDTGDILLQRAIAIGPEETAGELHDRMMQIGAEVILEAVQLLESGKASLTPQTNEAATPAPKLYHETCRIDFTQPATAVHDFIRGLSPYPGAWCMLDGREMKILRCSCSMHSDNTLPGSISTDHKKELHIKCQEGSIQVHTLKAEGKKSMQTAEFLNGYRIQSLSVH